MKIKEINRDYLEKIVSMEHEEVDSLVMKLAKEIIPEDKIKFILEEIRCSSYEEYERGVKKLSPLEKNFLLVASLKPCTAKSRAVAWFSFCSLGHVEGIVVPEDMAEKVGCLIEEAINSSSLSNTDAEIESRFTDKEWVYRNQEARDRNSGKREAWGGRDSWRDPR